MPTKIPRRVLTGLSLTLAVGFCLAATWGVPLSNWDVDGHWYYQNLQYLLTGKYTFPSEFASWNVPSQYFPLGGYSGLLIVCHFLAKVTGFDWATLVKISQLACFSASGLLLFSIGKRQFGPWTGWVVALLYYGYFPFANYALLIYSETLAVFILLLSYWLVQKGLEEQKSGLWIAGLLAGGYGVLVRPVFLFVVLTLTVWVLLSAQRRNFRLVALALGAAFLAPLLHSFVSKAVYGNYRISSGMGLHLWNRVVAVDHLYSADKRDVFRTLYQHKGRPPGFWWEDAPTFAALGMTESEVDKLFLETSLAGIATAPGRYAWGTLVGLRFMLTITPLEMTNFSLPSGYFEEMRFARHNLTASNPNAMPLLDRLLAQEPLYGRPMHSVSTALYSSWERGFFRYWTEPLHLWAFWGYALYGASLLGMCWTRRRRQLLPGIVLFVIPLMVGGASVLLEIGHSRYQLPFFPILMLLSVAATGAFFQGAALRLPATIRLWNHFRAKLTGKTKWPTTFENEPA